MTVNEIAMNTLDYVGKIRRLNLVDKAVIESINYVEKIRRLPEEVMKYNRLVRGIK